MTAPVAVEVVAYARSLPNRRQPEHRAVCSSTEFKAFEKQLVDELTAGESSSDVKVQRTKQDVRSRTKNVCCRTMLILLFGRIAAGETLITVLEFVDRLRAIIVTRYPSERCADLKTVQQMETELESAMNPVQWAVNNGDTSTRTLLNLKRLAARNRDICAQLVECVDAKLNPIGIRE